MPAHRLAYASNVHPGETLEEVEASLAVAAEVRARLGDAPLGIELRLGAPAIAALGDPRELDRLRGRLDALGLQVFTLNGFPLRPFHAGRVKEEVYRPDWTDPERADLTIALGGILAALLPEGAVGSVSTSPGSFKPWGDHRSLRAELARGFAPAIAAFDRLHAETGRLIRLAVEPEPCCTWETVNDIIDLVDSDLRAHAVGSMADDLGYTEGAALQAIRRHVGLCLDAAHLAVEFEDPARAFARLADARIPLAKVHVSCAARLVDPAGDRAGLLALRRLDEPRYLHQTFAADRHGTVVFRAPDLPAFLALPPERLADFAEVRTHFHMPLTQEPRGTPGTTRAVTEQVLRLAIEAGPCDFVNETYTWSVIDPDGRLPLAERLAGELAWTRSRLSP